MENKTLMHLIKYQKWYLLLLVLVVLGLPLLVNLIQDKPLLMSNESYYFLMETDEINYQNLAFIPLTLLNNILPEGGMVLVAMLIALLSVFLFGKFAKQRKLSHQFTFFFLLFFILSPAFIWSYSNLSFYAYYLLILLLGFFLLEQERREWRYFSIIFFILGTFFDIFSSIMTILLLIIYFFLSRKEQSRFPLFFLTIIGFFAFLNALISEQFFILGPFHQTNYLVYLISDLGGLSGISFFTLLIAFIGLLVTWKHKNSYVVYFFLPFLIPAYLFNPNTILLLSLLTTFFATIGFLKLLRWEWDLEKLKRITLFLLILGIIFSAISYLDRVNEEGPTEEDLKAYAFINEVSSRNFIIFTDAENSYHLKYYTGRNPLYYPHSKDKQMINVSQSILKAIYVDELFPILEDNWIRTLYLTPRMKAELPADYGLLFLLKNERFKLIYASEGYEVWEFKEA